jgi:hypothetical protein
MRVLRIAFASANSSIKPSKLTSGAVSCSIKSNVRPLKRSHKRIDNESITNRVIDNRQYGFIN